jgi:integrase
MLFTNVPNVYANCDLTPIVWQADFISGCRDFALQREVSGAAGTATDEFVNTYVGFVGGRHSPGQSEPCTKWPVQRYNWNDYAVSQGQKVRYRVIPMIASAAALTQPPQSEWSGWAKPNGMIGHEEAANLTDIPNIRQKGTRLGNWLSREQAKELLAVRDRSTLKGKRDYVILALLVGCALRRNELAELEVETIQQREGRWVLADLEGKGRRIRTVAVPIWVKQGIEAWTAAEIDKGRLLRSVSKSSKVNRDSLSDWAV